MERARKELRLNRTPLAKSAKDSLRTETGLRHSAEKPRAGASPRAAATIDVEHDRADKEAGKRIECPLLHLWAEGGPLDTLYAKDGGPLGIWRQWAPHARGQTMKGGHFFPEENPEDTALLVKQFLSEIVK